MQVMAHRYWSKADLLIEEFELGLKISQHSRSYLSRNWRLNDSVIKLVDAAIENGFVAAWRHGHPKELSFFQGDSAPSSGAHHFMFSIDHTEPWVFGFGAEAKPPVGKFLTFNGKLKDALDRAGVSNVFQVIGGKDIRVEFSNIQTALGYLAENYNEIFGKQGALFGGSLRSYYTNENDVHNALLKHVLHHSKFAHEMSFKADRLDYMTDRPDFVSIDARYPFVVEIKRGLVGISAFWQIERYLSNTAMRSQLGEAVEGVYIARDFERKVVERAAALGNVHLYQYGSDACGVLVLKPLGFDVIASNRWPQECRVLRA
jgi:hypothetical protein